MKRWELVTSDEYVTTTIEILVRSKKPIGNMREDLNQFFLKYRNELLHGDQGTGCLDKKCKVCYPYGCRK